MTSLNPVEFAHIVPIGDHFGLEASPDLDMEDREANSVAEMVGKLVLNLTLPEGTVLDVQTPDNKHFQLGAQGPGSQPS